MHYEIRNEKAFVSERLVGHVLFSGRVRMPELRLHPSSGRVGPERESSFRPGCADRRTVDVGGVGVF